MAIHAVIALEQINGGASAVNTSTSETTASKPETLKATEKESQKKPLGKLKKADQRAFLAMLLLVLSAVFIVRN